MQNPQSKPTSDSGAVAPQPAVVAVVGLAGAFPGAADLGAYWAQVVAGRGSVGMPVNLPGEDAGWEGGGADGAARVRAAGLAVARAALADAGCPVPVRAGVVLGGGGGASPVWWLADRLGLGAVCREVTAGAAGAMVALAKAVGELLAGRVDLMLAGGCSLGDPGSAEGAVGRGRLVRPFDRDAEGAVSGEGIGLLVLKRLADAERDGDRVYAVLRGVGGGGPRGVYDSCELPPESVELVEAHGSGCPAEDAAEAALLVECFGGGGERERSAVGSVKSLVGHLGAAAGAAGLIKAVLALHHRLLPPTGGVERPIEALAPGPGRPLYLNTEARPWIRDPRRPVRRAGVSALGLGGELHHAVLEEWGGAAPEVAGHATAEAWFWHAPDPDALWSLLASGAPPVGGAVPVGHARLGFVAEDPEVAGRLRRLAAAELDARPEAESWQHPEGIHYRRRGLAAETEVVALFGAEDGRYPDMGRSAAMAFPAVRAAFDAANCAAASADDEPSLAQAVFPVGGTVPAVAAARLRRPGVAAPAVAALALGQYRVLAGAGLRPVAVLGWGVGELTALGAAGGFEDEALMGLVAAGPDGPGGGGARRLPGQRCQRARASAPAEQQDELVDRLRELAADGPRVFVGFGPGAGIGEVVRRALGGAAEYVAVDPGPGADAATGIRAAVVRLAVLGVRVTVPDPSRTYAPAAAESLGGTGEGEVVGGVLIEAEESGAPGPEVKGGAVAGGGRMAEAVAAHLELHHRFLTTQLETARALGGLLASPEPARRAGAEALQRHSLALSEAHARAAEVFSALLGLPGAALRAAGEGDSAVGLSAWWDAGKGKGYEGRVESHGAGVGWGSREGGAGPSEAVAADEWAEGEAVGGDSGEGEAVGREWAGREPDGGEPEAGRAVGVVVGPAGGAGEPGGAGESEAGGEPEPGGAAERWHPVLREQGAAVRWREAYGERPAALLLDDDSRLARLCRAALRYAGFAVTSVGVPGTVARGKAAVLADWSESALAEVLGGVGEFGLCVLTAGHETLADPQRVVARLRHSVLVAEQAMAPLRSWAGAEQRAGFVTVTDLDGALGLAGSHGRWPAALAGGLGGLAKTLAREEPWLFSRAVDFAPELAAEGLGELFLAEIEDEDPGVTEVAHGPAGRRVVRLESAPDQALAAGPVRELGPEDLLLVTGGARGITSWCVQRLAEQAGCGLVLIGRTPLTELPDWALGLAGEAELRAGLAERLRRAGREVEAPAAQRRLDRQAAELAALAEIHATLARLAESGVRAEYLAVDLADAEAVRAVLEPYAGRITGLVHGAGAPSAGPSAGRTVRGAARVVDARLAGLVQLLDVLEHERLRELVLFSSAAGPDGSGRAIDQALANEALDRFACAWRADHPHCRVSSIAWGPWRKSRGRTGERWLSRTAGVDSFVRQLGPGRAGELVTVVGAAVAEEEKAR
ncbi:type I polyketide synthase [Kitasatospora sp. MMS16-BH015]|uniref:KR domain-containing protein n=1 Tax=Kitasatospora sp. MMS16-BH015 TaxID=2018025 RepID=UPI000CA3DC5F|nr:KR domain-containing protein [Kitasatospora sp. MMS16-BH015]AUG76499.1 type I polyketide synthase [Kitasatospora sp. MMS16-BH015]